MEVGDSEESTLFERFLEQPHDQIKHGKVYEYGSYND